MLLSVLPRQWPASSRSLCVDGIENWTMNLTHYSSRLQRRIQEFQFFTTQVGGRGNGITIEDGQVKTVAAKK